MTVEGSQANFQACAPLKDESCFPRNCCKQSAGQQPRIQCVTVASAWLHARTAITTTGEVLISPLNRFLSNQQVANLVPLRYWVAILHFVLRSMPHISAQSSTSKFKDLEIAYNICSYLRASVALLAEFVLALRPFAAICSHSC